MTDANLKPLPTWEDFLLVVLASLAEREMSINELEERVADHFNLDEEQRSRLIPSGRERTVNNRVRWSRYNLLRAGLLSRPKRGQYLINDAGRALLASGRPINDATLDEIRPGYRTSADGTEMEHGAVPSTGADRPDHALTPDEQIDAAVRIRAAGRTSLGQIAAALNERGIRTPRGFQWQPVQVKRVLERTAL